MRTGQLLVGNCLGSPLVTGTRGDAQRNQNSFSSLLGSSSLNLSPTAACSSSRLAGRPCAALHQTTRTNAEVRHACQGAPHTLVSARGGRSPLTCDPSLSAGPSVLDRVLESTSTKEKMAKYQAAVFKQCGAQPVSSCSAVAMDTRASRMMRPYLCVQPAEFPSSASLSLCVLCCPPGWDSRGGGPPTSSASGSEAPPCASLQR